MDESNPGKTVRLDVSIWFNEDQNNSHIASREGCEFFSTMSADTSSKRGHPNLFFKLARCLKQAGVPHPVIPEPYEDF